MADSRAVLKRRLACDRCRAQKLRCLKRPGDRTCSRCFNAQTACVFGPSRRGYRPHSDLEELVKMYEDSYTPIVEGYGPDAFQMDWSCQPPVQPLSYEIVSDLDVAFSNENVSKEIQNEAPPFGGVSPATHDTLQDVDGRQGYILEGDSTLRGGSLDALNPNLITKQLAELCLGLSEHTATIPPLSIHKPEPKHQLTESHGHPLLDQGSPAINGSKNAAPSHGNQTFHIGQTFHLTQSLLDIYPRVISMILANGAGDQVAESSSGSLPASIETASRHDSSGPATLDRDCSPTVGLSAPCLAPSPNHGLAFLLISCHHQVLDIWEVIFHHMRALAKLNVNPPCQKLQVGSFIASSSSTSTSVQSSLMTELVKRLLDPICLLRDKIFALSSALAGPESEEMACAGQDGGERGLCQPQSDLEIMRMAMQPVVERSEHLIGKFNEAKRRVDQNRWDAMMSCGVDDEI